MSFNRKILRKLILEEMERISEMEEFAGSKSGKAFTKEGARICASAKKIAEIASDQTGTSRRTIHQIAEFVNKIGQGISGINDLSEGGTADKLPTVQEFKSMIKAINKLES